MAMTAPQKFFGVLALTFAGAAFISHQDIETQALDFDRLEKGLAAGYQKSTCGKVKETKDIDSCMLYLDQRATGLVQQVQTLSGYQARKGSAQDKFLHENWVEYACNIEAPETLPEFSERVAPCLDAAVKIAHHFDIPAAKAFERVATVLKQQMEDAAKQAPYKTLTFI